MYSCVFTSVCFYLLILQTLYTSLHSLDDASSSVWLVIRIWTVNIVYIYMYVCGVLLCWRCSSPFMSY